MINLDIKNVLMDILLQVIGVLRLFVNTRII